MYFFIREEHNTNIKKGYACVYHLLRRVARMLIFRLHILNAYFYNQKYFFKSVKHLMQMLLTM